MVGSSDAEPASEAVNSLNSIDMRRVPDLAPTEITEPMRTFHAADVAEQAAAWKLHSPMWRMISARFYNLHSIDLRKHVKWIVKVNPTINASFDFVAVDAEQWADALLHAGF
jgi:hypothetical protein